MLNLPPLQFAAFTIPGLQEADDDSDPFYFVVAESTKDRLDYKVATFPFPEGDEHLKQQALLMATLFSNLLNKSPKE